MRAATRLASFSRSVLRVGFEPRLLDGPPSQFGASGAIAAAVGARSEALLGLRKLSISAWAPLGLAKAAVQQPGSVLAVLEGRSLRLAVARGFQSGMGSFADAAAARPSTRIAVGEQVPQGVQYKVIGRLELGKPYQVVAKDLFAVVEVGPHQFKVTTDDLIYVEKLGDVDINDKVVFSKVLMLGTPTQTTIGRPVVPSAEVHAVVEEQVRDAKQLIFKKRRRKNSRRLTAHRQWWAHPFSSYAKPLSEQSRHFPLSPPLSPVQQLTALRILDIILPGAGV